MSVLQDGMRETKAKIVICGRNGYSMFTVNTVQREKNAEIQK